MYGCFDVIEKPAESRKESEGEGSMFLGALVTVQWASLRRAFSGFLRSLRFLRGTLCFAFGIEPAGTLFDDWPGMDFLHASLRPLRLRVDPRSVPMECFLFSRGFSAIVAPRGEDDRFPHSTENCEEPNFRLKSFPEIPIHTRAVKA